MSKPALADIGTGALAKLIAPVTPADFFERHYEQTSLRVPGKGRDFTNLISIAKIDELIARQPFYDGEINLARSEPKVGPGDFLRENEADRGSVARLFQEGATIILPQLHRRVRALAQYCRGLEAAFSAHVQTNIYLTPGSAQGFQTHYDNHDVLVLQVEGTKRWRLYDSPAGVPFRGERFTPGQFAPGEPTEDFVLEPGDVLYVPRGLMHDAISEPGAPSLHITTGIITKTWADFLLEAVSEAALKTPELRRSLPPGFHRDDFDRSVFTRRFREAMQAARENADIEAVTDLFVDTFLRTRQADQAGAIAGGPAGPGTRIKVRPLVQLRLAEADETHIALVAPGGELMIDKPAEPGIEALLAGRTLTAADFAPLEEARAIDLVSRLMAFGVAERA